MSTNGGSGTDAARRPGLLSRLAHRLSASTQDLESEHLHELVVAEGSESIGHAHLRTQVTFRGTIAQITINPRGGNRWLEAELTDGTGSVRLIWMGRRVVPGIEPGRHLRVRGLLTLVDGQRAIYNPDYTLLTSA